MEPLRFGELYERYAPDVMRFALYLTGSRSEAEDITSETFVRAWARSDAIRLGTVKAYLLMIARNLHLDSRRREARRGEIQEEPRDFAPDPEAVSGARSELRAVLAALQRLPEVDRSALVMRAVDGLAYEDIAEALGVKPAAVRVKVHRARMKLAELAGQGEGQEPSEASGAPRAMSLAGPPARQPRWGALAGCRGPRHSTKEGA